MSVMVYPCLGEVLASKNVTVPELERKIKEQFGLSVKPEALYGLLLDEEPIRSIPVLPAISGGSEGHRTPDLLICFAAVVHYVYKGSP